MGPTGTAPVRENDIPTPGEFHANSRLKELAWASSEAVLFVQSAQADHLTSSVRTTGSKGVETGPYSSHLGLRTTEMYL